MKVTVLYISALFLFTTCVKDTGNILPEVSMKGLTITTRVNDYVPEEGNTVTRASGEHTFSFTTGDAIGVIGLKGGSVVDKCNNVKLTYAGNGQWGSDDLYDNSGATSYIAYYPFSSDMSGKTSVDAIKNAFTIKTDQSSEANFRASNLLTATASPSGERLNFNFTPAYAMVEIVKPDALEGYSNLNNEKYTYKFYSNETTAKLTLTSSGFYQVGDGKTYRKIIKPSTSTDMDVTISITDQLTVKYTKAVSVAPGNYKNLTFSPVNRNLVVGDFAYNMNGDIAFLPENITAPAAENCIGIIYWRGNMTQEDALMKKNNAPWTHGLVVALKDAGGATKWCKQAEHITTGWLSGKSTYGGIKLDDRTKMQGYTNMQALKDYNKEKGATDYKVLPIDQVSTFSSSTPPPSGTSGWYWLSAKEGEALVFGQGYTSGVQGKDMLNKQLQKSSAAATLVDLYFTSSEYYDEEPGPFASSLQAYTISNQAGWVESIGKVGNQCLIRCIFAF